MHPTSYSIALHQLQNIFPAMILPKFENSTVSLLDYLNTITAALPVPGEQDLTTTLSTMGQIMDQQEYKYQRSILEQHSQEQMMIFDEQCSYQQGSTGIMCKKQTICTQYDSNKSNFVDAIWNWKGEKQSEQPKQDYFYFFD